MTQPERRALDSDRLTALEHGHTELRQALAENTELTQSTADSVKRLERSTASLVSLLSDVEVGTQFMCRLARGVNWLLSTVRRYLLPLAVSALVTKMLWVNKVPNWAEFLTMIRELL